MALLVASRAAEFAKSWKSEGSAALALPSVIQHSPVQKLYECPADFRARERVEATCKSVLWLSWLPHALVSSPTEGLSTAFAPLYSWVYRRKGSVHRIDVGAACGRSELFCIKCVVSLGPAGRRNVQCCVLSDYARLLARSVLRTSVAGSGWVLPKHRLISLDRW